MQVGLALAASEGEQRHGHETSTGDLGHEQVKSILVTARVGRLMGRYAVPCIISLLVGALYNIIDQIFIANAAYLGSAGNAANTVVFPLTVIALGIAVLIGKTLRFLDRAEQTA